MDYRDIVADTAIRSAYNAYQAKYRDTLKESDKVLLSLIADALEGRERPALIDIGCSTGTLLGHVRHAFPKVSLMGCDLAASSIAEARKALPDVEFYRADMLALPGRNDFDLAVASAVTVYFTEDQYRQAMTSVAKCLKPGGVYIAFEWLHPYDQDIEIVERIPEAPEGRRFYFRPYRKVAAMLQAAGFSEPEFIPFNIGVDLPHQGFDGNPVSHTVMDDHGDRMCFRGALYQPWCFLRTSVAL